MLRVLQEAATCVRRGHRLAQSRVRSLSPQVSMRSALKGFTEAVMWETSMGTAVLSSGRVIMAVGRILGK